MKEHTPVFIHTPYIKLDQLLKLESIIETGGQIKFLLEDNSIMVNGEVCTQKRKKVFPGDVVSIEGVGSWQVELEEADE
ncbi:RNA-binding S4 domain-containing protein [uncultured Veillonella sp.]|uniref:RNA-binding S4 domain-containing protein n=1 Tax=uncultured Veillonella sp. TaxID=159268 RepID=UPI00261E20DC|nr:RNA-binding S4 domain-containing protein [uncultured Veillonella sp.]